MASVEDLLRRVYLRVPEEHRPPLKRAYHGTVVRANSVLRARPVVASERIVFLDFEIAHLEDVEFLGPAPGQVLVDCEATVVSPGTERNVLIGLPGTRRRFPSLPGYSGAGVVRAVGRGVTAFAPGDRVAGGLAHARAINLATDLLVKVPDGVASEEAAFVTLALIALLGVRKARIRPGERVAVVGQGVLGQLSNRLARLLTPAEVVAIGAGPARADIALAGNGADRFVALANGEAQLDGLDADVVIEIAGTANSMTTALRAAAPGGRVIVVGSTRSLDRHWLELARRRRVEIIGAHMSLVPGVDASPARWTAAQEYRLLMDLMQAGLLTCADLITARIDPRECNAFYEQLVRGDAKHLGVVFDWKRSAPSKLAAASVAHLADRTNPPESVTMEPLKIAIVGAGAIGSHNAKEAARVAQARIVGVFDANPRVAHEVASRVAAKPYADYTAVLNDAEVEAVLLSVPHHLHREMAVAAAAAGKHVMLEKPFANTLEEADAIVLACQSAGVALTVNFSFRYLPRIQAARALVVAGALGDITGIEISAHSYREHGYWYGARSNSPDDWRTNREKAGAGFLFMNLCHVIDYVYFITGLRAERAYAEYATLGSPTEVEDSVSISCRMMNGAIGTISGSTVRRGGNEAGDRIWGTHGSLRLDGDQMQVYSTRVIEGRKPGRWHRLARFPEVSWTGEWVKAFADAVRAGDTPPITARDGWDNLAFITTVLHSMEEQRSLLVPQYPHAH